MPKSALVIGIDQYESPRAPNLSGCIDDANRIAQRLHWHGNHSLNFETETLSNPTRLTMQKKIKQLFSKDLETVVLYFSGHGTIDETANRGFLISADGEEGAWGVGLSDILMWANEAYPRISNSVIILDCCYSGDMGAGAYDNVSNDGDLAHVRTGVTIMTASKRNEEAFIVDGRSVFTKILLQGLDGEAADVVGSITSASLYAHVDRSLLNSQQRPVYKANVQRFSTIRTVHSALSEADLRALPALFPDDDQYYELDPSCEPLTVADRADRYEATLSIAFKKDNQARYRLLQRFNREGLVVPVGAEHMWEAAVDSKGCRLTQRGMHYLYLAKIGRFGQPITDISDMQAAP